MNKVMVTLFISFILLTTFVSAAYNYDYSADANANANAGSSGASASGSGSGSGDANGSNAASVTVNAGSGVTVITSSGVSVSVAGGQVNVLTRDGRVHLVVGNVDVDSDGVEVTVENGKVIAHTSNGANAEVKIMPTTASETAIAQLQLHVCTAENNCMIQFKEVGSGSNAKVAYNVQATKKVKVLGIFNADEEVSADVDASSGTVISTHRPWWSFLASDVSASSSTSVSVK